MSRSARCLAALLAGLVVTGCATVPISGPVERHTPQATGVNSGVHVDPLPPGDGASQLLVVEGFLHAMSVYQPDYAVARQYLTDSASKGWHPESGVQVYADGFPPTDTGSNVVLSGVPVTGTVDAAGSYKPLSGTTQTFNFNLIKDADGQWRISSPPQGLLVSRYVFTTGFLPVNLHFLDTSGSVLVPDPRFFADGNQALAAAAQAQMSGPSAWLAPAVRKPDTTGVTVGNVTVDGAGTADVALGGTADRLSADQRRIVLAELAYTLTGFDQVDAVRVTGGGQPWRDDFGQEVVRPESYSQLAPEGTSTRVLFMVREHKVERLRDPTNWSDFVTVDVALVRPEQIAVSADLAQFAATTGGGTRLEALLAGSDKPRVVRTGVGLLRPAFSRNGEVWSPAAGGPTELQVFKGDQKVKVTLSKLPDQKVRALTLSPDGVRAAMILRQGGVDTIGLVRVERSDSGITLSGWRTVDPALSPGGSAESLDLGWVSDTELAVLRSGDKQTSVVRMSQDGAASADIGPSEADDLDQLAVAPGQSPVALGTDGNVYRYDSEFNWNLAVSSVEAAAYSG